MTVKLPNLIAAEDLESCNTWRLPDMGDGNKVLPAQILKRRQLEAQQRAEAELKRQQDEQAAEQSGEVIEEVSGDELAYTPMTAEQLQEITEAAEQEGFDRGYGEGVAQGLAAGKKQGYEDGLAQAQAHVQETLAQQVSQLLQVAEALVEPIGQQEQQLQQLLLRYVTTLTEQVIGRELKQDIQQLLSVIERAMQALPVGAENVKVALNPDDLALVTAHAGEQDPDWLFVSDPHLQPGGCRIETAESLVDFSVESRVKVLFAEFLNQQLVVADSTDTHDAGLDGAVSTEEPQHEPG